MDSTVTYFLSTLKHSENMLLQEPGWSQWHLRDQFGVFVTNYQYIANIFCFIDEVIARKLLGIGKANLDTPKVDSWCNAMHQEV